MQMKEPFKFVIGMCVRKVDGYGFPGTVVSAYHTLGGKSRYVVECTVYECKGMQHIFNGSQLELDR